MRRGHAVVAWVIRLSVAVGPVPPGLAGDHEVAGQASEGGVLALVGGTIYVSPADAPISDGTLLIRDGRVAAVGKRAAITLPPGARTLDCRGLVLTAGFWNSHVHFIERKWAQPASIPSPELAQQLKHMLTRYGFTTVLDTGSVWENTRALRQRIESGGIPGPTVLSSGEILLPRGGRFPADVMQTLGFMPLPFPEIEGEDDARRPRPHGGARAHGAGGHGLPAHPRLDDHGAREPLRSGGTQGRAASGHGC